jgi:hypothetical protein
MKVSSSQIKLAWGRFKRNFPSRRGISIQEQLEHAMDT